MVDALPDDAADRLIAGVGDCHVDILLAAGGAEFLLDLIQALVLGGAHLQLAREQHVVLQQLGVIELLMGRVVLNRPDQLTDLGQALLGPLIIGEGGRIGVLHQVVDKLLRALAALGGDGDHRRVQFPAQAVDVNRDALLGQLIQHVDGDDHRQAELLQLHGQIQVALQIRAVDDVDDQIRMLIHDEVTRDDFLHRIGGKRVDARQVNQRDLVLLVVEHAFLFLNRDARPVADMLLGTGQTVEQRGLAAVGIADQCYGLPLHSGSTSIRSASSLRRLSSYPRISISIGSPIGAMRRTMISVPVVIPMSIRRLRMLRSPST